MTEDQLYDQLKKLEPGWKTDPLYNKAQQEVYARPTPPRINRFKLDDGLEIGSVNTGTGGGPPNISIPTFTAVICYNGVATYATVAGTIDGSV